jgi:hypothetical protein
MDVDPCNPADEKMTTTAMLQSSTFTSDFPSECFGHICSFMDLRDVLNFGSCSLSSTQQILPELCHRRKRMTKRFAYWRDWKIISALETNKIGIWDEVKEKFPNMNWVLIPTVQESVDELCKRMPSSHPLHHTATKLRAELRTELDYEEIARKRVAFEQLFPAQQQIVHAHKLHAKILSDAMRSDPLNGGNSTTLEQYIGDVLSVAYLINQSTLRLVEGGPTNATFTRVLHNESENSLGYRSWVFMHSSILRVKPFTSNQRLRLRTPDLCKISEFLPNDCYVNESFLSSKMRVVLDDFGPLGPAFAFRGRDIVSLRDIPARCLFAFFISNDTQTQTTRGALDWLCLVHEEARKSRPMSVRSPLVRFYGNEAA